ncbi:alcohol dehydrogenase [Mollisia scopiformis]|uniref:Alcohol dehydrogenase n=1 Tax=Mollisia scopiformis TaxID=149040 RepID=A0A132BDJ7_MOLSC|nr:alcohol dehydrogenase [Mollisia scopiformis]KUJ10500.1 alcohol dehydrogenase [Mollisia scopiformis]
MSQLTNTALWMDENCECSVRRNHELPIPGDGEVLVQVLYSGINPADIKHATHLGIRPVVMGYDFSGRVIKASSGSKLEAGDIIAGYTPTGLGRASRYGTHQTYLACPEDMVFKVPDHVPHADAACLTTVVKTAADALFNILEFNLPPKSSTGSVGPVLIWGASSSVGICCVQFARAVGARHVMVTASTSRHEELKALGATQCFDYKSPEVTRDIKETIDSLGSDPVLHAIDAVGTESEPSSADLLSQCVAAEANLLSVIVRRDPKFGMPLACKSREVKFRLPIGHEILLAPNPSEEQRMDLALQWVLENYGRENGFVLPHVRIIEHSAEETLKELQHVANQGAGFEKIVIKHPLQ